MLNPRRSEQASALIAAVALMILGSFVVVAIMVSTRSSHDTARDRLESGASEQLARDASAALTAAYSSLQSGEHDGFVPGSTTLANHASRIGGDVRPNGSITGAPWAALVDTSRVPARGRFTVRQPLQDGRIGYWQLFSVRLPTWGATSGGRVTVYVRTWSGSGSRMTQPAIHRLELRPSWFADYQMLFDGPFRLGDGARLTGRIHSNGYTTSFFDQYRLISNKIEIDSGASCGPSARITSSSGGVGGIPGVGPAPASCTAVARSNTGERINLLRARDLATRVRAIACGPAAGRPSLAMSCPTTTGLVTVVLMGDRVLVSPGGGTINARVGGDRPTDNQGAVVIVRGDVRVVGTLGPRSRAMVIAAAESTASTYGSGGAPSARITSGGTIGADRARTSSFGLVTEGDITFDERVACPVTVRGAFLTITGLMSIHPTWRIPIYTQGGTTCPSRASIEGSIVGHYPPLMLQEGNGAGYANRTYTALDSLFDNPPPLYPTASDWEITKMTPANLDCFDRSGGSFTLGTGPACS